MKKFNVHSLALMMFFALLSSISTYAQSYFEYKYDDSGNRIQRKVIIVPSSPPPPPAIRAYTPDTSVTDVANTAASTDSSSTLKTDSSITAQNNSTNNTVLTPADVFPNPTYGLVNVMIKEQGTFKGVLINSEGKTVLQTTFQFGPNTIDLSNYGDGVFILRIDNSSGKTQEFKIIKQS